VSLYAAHRGAEVPALQKVEFLAELPKPCRRAGFKTYPRDDSNRVKIEIS
jgi:hypothetical protein